MKILLIYNPTSGNGTFINNLDSIIRDVQNKGFHLIPFRISADITMEKMFSNTDMDSFSRIWIAGGDGTIHQVLNWLFMLKCEIPVGIYPVGTANDFARNFNFPESIDEMTEILLGDNYTYCDIGVANGHYFLNVASLGSLVDVSQKMDGKVKKSFGVLGYYLKGVEEFANLKTVKVCVRSKEYNNNDDDDVYFILLMNGKSAGGFTKIAPLASLVDGLIDVYIFKKCSILEMISLVIKVTNGEHADSPYVDYFQTTNLMIDCNEIVGTDMDGEKGFDFPLSVSVESGKLKLITRNNQEAGN